MPIHFGGVRGHGELDLKCARCGELVVEGGRLDLVLERLFECPGCERLVRLDVELSQLGLVLVH